MRRIAGLALGLILLAAPAAAQDMKAFYAEVLTLQDKPDDLTSLRERLGQSDSTMPKNMDQLDKLLADDKPRELLSALMQADDYEGVVANMNWERLRIYGGANIAVAFAYLTDLQRTTPPGARGDDLRDTQAAMAAYVFAVIRADGARCADPTAPAKRLQQLVEQNPEVMAHAAKLPKDRRETVKYLALISEIATAQARKNDGVLCAPPVKEGMLGIMQGLLTEAEKPGQMECTQGDLGKNCVLPNPAAKFRPESEWRAGRDAARKALPDEMDRFLKLGG